MNTNYLEIAIDLSRIVYGRRVLSQKRQGSSARLLLEVAATESHFIHRRQSKRGGGHLSFNKILGAWGICQTEWGAVSDSIKLLKRRKTLAKRLAVWYFGHEDATLDLVFRVAECPIDLLRWISSDDRLAFMFCRLHFFRQPEAVPVHIEDRAIWYKRIYNTAAGAGSVRKYTNDAETYLDPLLERFIK